MTKKSNQIGLPPGSIVYTGSKELTKIPIHYLKYNAKVCEDLEFSNQGEVLLHRSKDDAMDWYDIRGLHDTQLIHKIGEMYEIHSLVLEDIADVSQRPKFEEYEKGIFITMKALNFDVNSLKLEREQISIFFQKGILFSFQESESDLFAAVRKRIVSGKGRIRERSADYLAYAIMDSLVDQYYTVIEKIDLVLENLEDHIMDEQAISQKGRIHKLKKEIIGLRKTVMPLREVVSRFAKAEHPMIEDRTQVFVRDLYDHTIQIMDSVDSLRDLLYGLQDLFINEVSFKMNQVMQMLTIISAIFIPLTFLAGLYGMNFENIPELNGKYNYFILLGVMLAIFLFLLWYFKRKKWL